MTRCAAAFVLALSWAAPALAANYGPAAPVYREIGDWILACDNTRDCVAKAAPDPQGPAAGQQGFVRFERAGGPDGVAQLVLSARGRTPDAISLDGHALDAEDWSADSQQMAVSLEGAAALDVMRAIRGGALLRLAGGQDAPAVSLRGLSAVLAAMDDDQGRTGNVTALARLGEFPATTTSPAVDIPLVRGGREPPPLSNAATLIAVVRRAHAAALQSHDCEDGQASLDAAAPLNREEAIVLLGCRSSDGQALQLAFRLDRDAPQRAKLLVLPQPPIAPKPAPAQAGLYADAGYDATSAVFSQSAKGRGLGDCGISTQWVFDGREFVLSALNYQARCGGGAPGDWPALYRTQAAPPQGSARAP